MVRCHATAILIFTATFHAPMPPGDIPFIMVMPSCMVFIGSAIRALHTQGLHHRRQPSHLLDLLKQRNYQRIFLRYA